MGRLRPAVYQSDGWESAVARLLRPDPDSPTGVCDIPSVEQFIADPFYLGDLVEPVPAQVDVLKTIFDPAALTYNEVGLACGLGWGKGTAISIALPYMVYRLLCLADPSAFYGLAPGSRIGLMNFSVTATQAKEVLFEDVAARIDESPAFQRLGFRRDKRVRSRIVWPEAGIAIVPGNSRATSGLGRNILAACVDECSWFPRVLSRRIIAGEEEAGEIDAARSLSEAIHERTRTRGNSRWKRDSIVFNISSPRSQADWIQELRRQAEAGAPNILYLNSPTWEGYPGLMLCGEVFQDEVCGAVPIEFQEDFRRNPERARRNLGAIAPERYSGFFADAAAVERCFDPTLPNCLEAIETDRGTVLHRVKLDARGKPNVPYYIHVDLALRRDACGFALCHGEGNNVVCDGWARIRARDFHENEIDLDVPVRLITALKAQGFQVAASYDGYQSAHSIQMLRQAQVPCKTYSVDRGTQAYDTLLDLVTQGRLKLPECDVLLAELLGLEYDQAKGKVDHSLSGSKDLADALAGAAFHVIALGMQRVETGASASKISALPGGLDERISGRMAEIERKAQEAFERMQERLGQKAS